MIKPAFLIILLLPSIESGYKAIFITVDAPVTANRLRKKRKSLQLPPHLSYPNLSDNSDRSSDKSGHDPGKRWDEVIPWVKANTSLEVWVKGSKWNIYTFQWEIRRILKYTSLLPI